MTFEKSKILKKIKPKKEEENKIKAISEKLIQTAEKISEKYGFKPMLCGSVAKGTWIPPGEIDLFLLFPEELSRKDLERKGLNSAKAIGRKLGANCYKKYSEHPYLRCVYEGIEIDIVPCFDTKPDKIKSAVDRTPWHVRYVLSKLKDDQKDEVRLLKQFLKANELYGADLIHRGFSGYLSELLIIKFGSFENLIKHATEWYPPVVLWLENKPNKKIIQNFDSPLIFIDPVDPKRNVAAALSYETFFKFVKTSKEFLSKPSISFFVKKEKLMKEEKLKKVLEKRDSKFYILRFEKPNEHEDILVSQLRKLSDHIKYNLHKLGFKIIKVKEFVFEKSMGLVLESEIWKLPKVMKRIGPDVKSKTHSLEFLKHYSDKQAWIEDGKWVIEDERKITSIEEFFHDYFKGSKNTLIEKGIPSKIAIVTKTLKIYEGDKNVLKLNKNKEFSKFFYNYFTENMNIQSLQNI